MRSVPAVAIAWIALIALLSVPVGAQSSEGYVRHSREFIEVIARRGLGGEEILKAINRLIEEQKQSAVTGVSSDLEAFVTGSAISAGSEEITVKDVALIRVLVDDPGKLYLLLASALVDKLGNEGLRELAVEALIKFNEGDVEGAESLIEEAARLAGEGGVSDFDRALIDLLESLIKGEEPSRETMDTIAGSEELKESGLTFSDPVREFLGKVKELLDDPKKFREELEEFIEELSERPPEDLTLTDLALLTALAKSSGSMEPSEVIDEVTRNVVVESGDVREFIDKLLSSPYGAAYGTPSTVSELKRELGLPPVVTKRDLVATYMPYLRDEKLRNLVLTAVEDEGNLTAVAELLEYVQLGNLSRQDLIVSKFLLTNIFKEELKSLDVDISQFQLTEEELRLLEKLILGLISEVRGKGLSKELLSKLREALREEGGDLSTFLKLNEVPLPLLTKLISETPPEVLKGMLEEEGGGEPLKLPEVNLRLLALATGATALLIAAALLIGKVEYLKLLVRSTGKPSLPEVGEVAAGGGRTNEVVKAYWTAVSFLSRLVPRKPSETHREYLVKVRGGAPEVLGSFEKLTTYYELVRYSRGFRVDPSEVRKYLEGVIKGVRGRLTKVLVGGFKR